MAIADNQLNPPMPQAPAAPLQPPSPHVDEALARLAYLEQAPRPAFTGYDAAPTPVYTPEPAAVELPAQAPALGQTSGPIDPYHYSRFKIQPIQFIRENNLPFWAANVVKYVCREDVKNGVEDIEKAISYLLKERAYLLDPTSKWWETQLPGTGR